VILSISVDGVRRHTGIVLEGFQQNSCFVLNPFTNRTGASLATMVMIRFCRVTTRATVLAVVAAASMATIAARARAETHTTLTVRLYNTAGIPADELAAARSVADAILRDTGLTPIFRPCGQLAGGTDSCDEPLKRSEVVVRIIDAPAFNPTLHPDAFGVTYLVRETNRGWLATVFADRIGAAAERVRVDHGTLLGRVMAHEIGHLLLGIDYHGPAGVMRAEWPDDSLNRDADDWRFSMLEAERMQRVLESL